MNTLLEGFNDELEKLATPRLSDAEKQRRQLTRDLRQVSKKARPKSDVLDRLRGQSSPRQRDYLTSATLAAVTYPLIGLLNARVGRALRNRSTLKAMRGTRIRQRKVLRTKLEQGPLVAKSHLSKSNGQMSREDLATRAIQGGIVGSLVMGVRDRFAGSTPVT